MAATQLRGTDVYDGSVTRVDLNVLSTGLAVIRQMVDIANSGVKISTYTGADKGTGDVGLILDWTLLDTRWATSAWAKAATKPSYVKSEVGLDLVDNTADANKTVAWSYGLHSFGRVAEPTVRTILKEGVYTYSSYTQINTNPTNFNEVIGFGTGYSAIEISGGWHTERGLSFRSLRDTTDPWSAWTRVWDASNLNLSTIPFSASTGTFSGSVTTSSGVDSGSFIINNSAASIESRRWAIMGDGYGYGDLVIKTSLTQTGAITTNRFIIKQNGTVGIGTSTPTRQFVISNSGAHGIEFRSADGTGGSDMIAYNRSTSAYIPLTFSASAFNFTEGGTATFSGNITAGGGTFYGTVQDSSSNWLFNHSGQGYAYTNFAIGTSSLANGYTFYVGGATATARIDSTLSVGGTGTFAGEVYAYRYGFKGTSGESYIYLPDTGAHTGSINMQAGFGSAAAGGSLTLYGQSHAASAGCVNIGLTATGAKFRIRDLAFGGGSEVASIDRVGNATFSGSVTANKLIISGDATNNLGELNLTNTAVGGKAWRIGDGIGTPNGVLSIFNTTANFLSFKMTSGGDATFSGSVTAGTGQGFLNATYQAGYNRIWAFGNATPYGMGYYQAWVGGITDAIGFHFGDTAIPKFYVTTYGNGTFTGTGHTTLTINGGDTYSPRINFASPTYPTAAAIDTYMNVAGSSFLRLLVDNTAILTAKRDNVRIGFAYNADIGTNIFAVNGNVSVGNTQYQSIGLDVSTIFPKVTFGTMGSYIGYDYNGNERIILNSRYAASHYEFQIGGVTKFNLASDGSAVFSGRVQTSGLTNYGTFDMCTYDLLRGGAAAFTGAVTAPGGNSNQWNEAYSLASKQWVKSSRDFADGTLIQTNLWYNDYSGDAFLLEIKGNSYGSLPFDLSITGYMYANTLINVNGLSKGQGIPGLIAFNLNGYLHFWFPRMGYWQGFSVYCSAVTGAGAQTNSVVAITNSLVPAGRTKEVGLTASVTIAWNAANFSPSTYLPIISSNNIKIGDIILLGNDTSVATTALRGLFWHTNNDSNYGIFKPSGTWTQPLNIAFYTGIHISGHYSYGGTRFYETPTMTVELMSIGNGDDHVRIAYNLYVAGSGTFQGGGFQSQREIKNIHKDWSGSALNVIAKFKVRDFNYKTRPDHDRTLGFIIDEIPKEIGDYALSGEEKNAVNTYTLHGLSFKGLQEVKTKLDVQSGELDWQSARIILLEKRIAELEGRLN